MSKAKRYTYTDKWGDAITIFFIRGAYQQGQNLFVECECEHYDEEYDETCVEGYAPVTVNFGDEGMCEPDEAFVDANNSGHLINWLIAEGYVVPTGITIASGFCVYPQVRFTKEFLDSTGTPEDEAED
jgi:hypothetical protein